MVGVDVEVVGLGRAPGPVVELLYGTRRRAVVAEQSPDDVAAALAEGVEVLHSTSWRFEAGGTVVLTYAAAPVPAGEGMHPLIEPSVVCSGDPLRPSPPDVHAHHVAAHAARHLAYLLDRDPGVAAAASRSSDPRLWTLIAGMADIPTGTHREAHRQALLQARPGPRLDLSDRQASVARAADERRA